MIDVGYKISSRYILRSYIAKGGMADVYEADDLIEKKKVTVKILRLDLCEEQEALTKFKNEAAAASSLNHPNIVRIFSSGTIENRPYIVNEYIKGQTLREKLKFSLSFSLNEACEIIIQLCDGLSYIHNHGIVHRDIKPENLFYMADASVKIADFGVASKIGDKPTSAKIEGTVYYCAPEMLLGEPACSSNDIYAAGIIFYELLTGKLPFSGLNVEEVAKAHINSKFPEPSKVLPSLPKIVDKIIITACRKRADERYASALEMKEAIIAAMKDKKNFKEKKGLLHRLFGFK